MPPGDCKADETGWDIMFDYMYELPFGFPGNSGPIGNNAFGVYCFVYTAVAGYKNPTCYTQLM